MPNLYMREKSVRTPNELGNYGVVFFALRRRVKTFSYANKIYPQHFYPFCAVLKELDCFTMRQVSNRW